MTDYVVGLIHHSNGCGVTAVVFDHCTYDIKRILVQCHACDQNLPWFHDRQPNPKVSRNGASCCLTGGRGNSLPSSLPSRPNRATQICPTSSGSADLISQDIQYSRLPGTRDKIKDRY